MCDVNGYPRTLPALLPTGSYTTQQRLISLFNLKKFQERSKSESRHLWPLSSTSVVSFIIGLVVPVEASSEASRGRLEIVAKRSMEELYTFTLFRKFVNF